MHSIRNLLCLAVFLSMLAVPAGLHGQKFADVNDKLYDLLELWHEHGYVSKLPILQPYPLKVIVAMLNEVREKAPPPDSTIAEEYIEFFGKGDPGAYRMFHSTIRNDYLLNGSDVYGNNIIEETANGSLGDYVDFSGWLDFQLKILPNTDFFPMYSVIIDEAQSGGANIDIPGRRIEVDNMYQGAFFIGDENLWLQAGIIRSSFGPFFENSAVIGPQCYANGHLSFTWDIGWFNYTSILLDLMPKYKEDPLTGATVAISTPSNKYLIIYTFGFVPCDFISFGFLQTMVTGQLRLSYLVPFQDMMFTQVLYGSYENSMMGAYVQARLPFSFELDAVLYIDDFSFDKFTGLDGGIPFNLDSAQNKVALQAGATWAPCSDFLRKTSLTYTLVTPYMYTHIYRSYDLTYTHHDTHLGSVLDPNSDELIFTYVLSPFRLFDSELKLRYVRHGNASEDYPPGNGTIYDDGYYSGETPSFLGASRFLTQRVIEHTLQISLDVSATFRLFDTIKLDAGIGYMFEYVWNKNIESGNNRVENIISLSVATMY
jgi:hypothetical protein